MVVETELASTFKVAARDGNTLSPIVRQAWDTGDLRTLTRNNPLHATGAHISIIGHITREELLRHLTSTEAANGFGNRFVWLRVRRSKSLPDGGALDERDLAPHVDRVRKTLTFARQCGRIERDEDARRLWWANYDRLSQGETGLVGSLLARSEAHVLRLSMVYALADMSATIREPHLQAALDLWGYADRSVRSLFGNTTGNPDADRILHALASGAINRTEISNLFGRHADRGRIERALHDLTAGGHVDATKIPTDGRPSEQWALTSHSSLVSLPQEWPEPPSDSVYHGHFGEIVRLIEPHTEADPIAVLAQLLVALGNAIGRTPYAQVEADKHHTNTYLVLVGDTAKARKGTSWGWPRRIITAADPDWEPRVMGGLSSGEGLIAQVSASDGETSEGSESR